MQCHVKDVSRAVQSAVSSQVPVQNSNVGISFHNEKDKHLITDMKEINSRSDKDLVAIEYASIAIVNDTSMEDGEILEEANVAELSMDGNGNSSSKNIITSQPVILKKNMFDILNNVDEDVSNVENVMGRSIDDDVKSSSILKDMALIVENAQLAKPFLYPLKSPLLILFLSPLPSPLFFSGKGLG
ncbi:hypothetical protein MA16_Dca023081 [Dendrobium catenatum]|uniref:Uncharacterized protein n=1 Tax=Dendrobium catenatum TaxID=906689 RepID=A0A2I0VCS9_9ASPA|nr:hypothetical protein MA16_Dca023081 [Dendrobium catenatum]